VKRSEVLFSLISDSHAFTVSHHLKHYNKLCFVAHKQQKMKLTMKYIIKLTRKINRVQKECKRHLLSSTFQYP